MIYRPPDQFGQGQGVSSEAVGGGGYLFFVINTNIIPN